MAKKKSLFNKTWGYAVLALAIFLLAMRELGPLAVSGAFAVSGIWLLLGAPTWCGAKNRGDGFCRENSSGLLRGCHRRQHKWQRFRALTRHNRFTETFRGWFTGAQQQVATVALIVSAVGVVAGIFT